MRLQEEKQQQQAISSYVGKILRDTFGKGPESVYVSFGKTFITIYLRNFLTPAEKVLLDQDQIMIIYQMRLKLLSSLAPEIMTYIKTVTGRELREFYFDWNIHNRSGIIAGVSSEPFEWQQESNDQYEGKVQMDREIIKISQQAQKAPEEVYSCELNERTLVVIRNGILVRIEKELIREGYEDLLKNVKRNLEKSYLHNTHHFESLLRKRVIDVFVDWDFNLDKSLIVFILNPKKPWGQDIFDQIDREP